MRAVVARAAATEVEVPAASSNGAAAPTNMMDFEELSDIIRCEAVPGPAGILSCAVHIIGMAYRLIGTFAARSEPLCSLVRLEALL